MKIIEQILHTHLSDDVSLGSKWRKQKNDLPLRLTARHFPSRINTGENKKKIGRRCHVHSNTILNPQSRKDTSYKCNECGKYLCLEPCFKDYHTKLNY